MKFYHRKHKGLHDHHFTNLAKHKKAIANPHVDYENIVLPHYLYLFFHLAKTILPLYKPPKEAYARAYSYLLHNKNNKRNRFQNFFYKLSFKIERACSSIEDKIESIKASNDDF